jgi:hypothetical protein
MRILVLGLTAFALLLGTTSTAVAAKSDPNEKTTVTQIQWRISYSVTIPGNCAVLGFSQWEIAKFKGWDAYKVGTTPVGGSFQTYIVSPPPLYDDQLPYGGNIVSPPGNSHWLLIGDGSFRAGPPPAEADCLAMLGRAQTGTQENKVTTFYRRTSTCATRYAKLTKAESAYKKAKKKKGKKGKKARSKAKANLKKAQKSFNKSCTK